jgi:hypothetical protein
MGRPFACAGIGWQKDQAARLFRADGRFSKRASMLSKSTSVLPSSFFAMINSRLIKSCSLVGPKQPLSQASLREPHRRGDLVVVGLWSFIAASLNPRLCASDRGGVIFDVGLDVACETPHATELFGRGSLTLLQAFNCLEDVMCGWLML